MNLVERLKLAALRLEDSGFACDDHTARALARAFGTSTVPVAALLHWLARTPEAAELLSDAEPAQLDKRPAKTSEPAGGTVNGVKGASAPSITVTNDTAAAALAAVARPGSAAHNLKEAVERGFTTRPVAPEDTQPEGLGMGTATAFGLSAVCDAAGKPIVAAVRLGRRQLACEFLEKRGPLILARVAGKGAAGAVYNVCEKHIEPKARPAVLAALSSSPDAEEGFNFNPFDGMPDAWGDADQPEHESD